MAARTPSTRRRARAPRWLARALLALAALSVVAAALIFFIVPERPLPGQGEPWREQLRMVGRIFARLDFWRLALPLVICQASFQALQGLWFAPWLADVHGLSRGAAAAPGEPFGSQGGSTAAPGAAPALRPVEPCVAGSGDGFASPPKMLVRSMDAGPPPTNMGRPCTTSTSSSP